MARLEGKLCKENNPQKLATTKEKGKQGYEKLREKIKKYRARNDGSRRKTCSQKLN